MTAEELKSHITRLANFGDLLKLWIPGEIDDRVVEYVKALAASDELLTLIAEDISPQVLASRAATGEKDGPGDIVVMNAAGQEVERLSPEIWILLITELLPILLEWIRNRRGGGGGLFNRPAV